ncbi:Enoyl-CoA hydratase/carnithine racemase [Lutimaribacter pacificus]|uniref:Enoyl-CoA hydratase domain-containing protein 3, mitochondrial n=1 Tax=Lutimaribacter pacificus TaxID=391948 RepID=A0A1H0F4V1_9RHOB|nr:enoyl-CoA hydratase [Lutimaribacter pacificus]SDN89690.1 Enoyl-CoA hydratase/carnithine racemase [Lutimaribacter pacificus]SHK44869.1 Enoyl-CoA hydratase/carnithine racemase [Lutimaribacter pacificus]
MALLERHDTGAVAHLTLNAPEKLNALSDAMLAALQAEFDRLRHDTATRAVIIKGAGKVFCAGHDLKEMTAGRQAEDGGKAYFKDLFDRCARMMTTIRSLPQPVIAQAHGIATAAGCQLVASCDMAVAAEGTKFGVNGVNIGLFCSTPMVPLSRNIPRKHAFEMLSTGQFIPAERAEALGLVNRVVPHEQLDTVTQELAETVAAKLGAAVKIGKEAFYNQIEMPLDAAYDYAGDVMVQNMLYRDTAEGIAAFLEKRPPDWQQ